MRPVLHFATALWLGAASAALTDTPLPDADALVLAREHAPLGWATMEGGTTGGARAGEGAIHVVSDRASLIAALGGDNASNATNDIPAIIFLSGTIDLAADESGRSLTAADFADPAYDRDAYIAAYDPATYGRDKDPEGPLEEARARSQEAQAAHTVIHIGSNKTLFGLGDARILNGTLDISGVDNVIVRNITFEDSYDMFPMWDGTDGAEGNWNSEYDLVTIRGATHVWVDHSAFSDGARPDNTSGEVFGKLVQHHDGLIDITNGADFVTLTANRYFEHDKTHLIGSSDKREEDRGHLRVTLAGNWYDNLRQRLPRVRFGRVHVFGNLYTPSASGPYSLEYALGVGLESGLLAENNVFVLPAGVDPAGLIRPFKGEAVQVTGSLVNDMATDLVDLYNSAYPDQPLSDRIDWTPPYHYDLPDTGSIADVVRMAAGPGLLD